MLEGQPMCNHVVELIFTTLEAQRASYTYIHPCNKMQFTLKVVHSHNYLRHTPPYKLVTDFVDSKLALFDPKLGGAKLLRTRISDADLVLRTKGL